MATLTYFAYGSNMYTRRLRARVPSTKPIGLGYLPRHRLTFDKVSKDGSGKCDAEFTNNDQDGVWGVLFSIDSTETKLLDDAEGLGHGYDEKPVTVTVGTQQVQTFLYYATKKRSTLKPYDWYKAYVLFGAREHGLPKTYIAATIKPVDADKDRRPEAADEWKLLRWRYLWWAVGFFRRLIRPVR